MSRRDQVEDNREALSRAVNEKLAEDLGCGAHEDVLGLSVDRALAQSGLLPREALAELSPDQRAVVLAGLSEDEACAHVASLEAHLQGDGEAP